MKIAYIIAPTTVISGRSNGIRSQVLTWVNALNNAGYEVELINLWNDYAWEEFDIIHFFGNTGDWSLEFAKRLIKYNKNLIFSPICDETSIFKQRIKTYIGCKKLQVWSYPYIRKQAFKYFKGICVRSEQEAKLINKIYNIDYNNIFKVPLCYNKNAEINYNKETERENFCLHISSIYQPRKNVIRLIKAAKKYDFKLVLAGAKGTDKEFDSIRREIDNSCNIDVLGFISEEEKLALYNRAKVFALPSIEEGVGIVALDAAVAGCEIAITNINGPSEYYPDNLVYKINPYKVDEIGKAIIKLMSADNQPELRDYLINNYSEKHLVKLLLYNYEKLLSNN